jgi:hypothetical protein
MLFVYILNLRQLKVGVLFGINSIDVLMKKTKTSQILPLSFYLFLFFLLLLSIYIPMLFCKFYTQFRKKTREISIVFLDKKKYYSSLFFLL